MEFQVINWMLKHGDAWVRYKVLVELLDIPESSTITEEEKEKLFKDKRLQRLLAIVDSTNWSNPPWTYLRDASLPVHILAVLADFGLKVYDDYRLWFACQNILKLQNDNGELKFKPYIVQPLTCLSSTLLYPLVKMGIKRDQRIIAAVKAYLDSPLFDKGWKCTLEPFIGYLFKSEMVRKDYRLRKRENFLKSIIKQGLTCPLATLNILRVLVEYPELLEHPRVIEAADGLLEHWRRRDRPYGFGIGTRFMKLKYPFIWYDILKYASILSRISYVKEIKDFRNIVNLILSKRLKNDLFKPGSIYRAWRDFDFGKKESSPWITFLVYKVLKCMFEN